MADGVSLKWHGAIIAARIEAELNRRLARSAVRVANRAKELVSTPYPPASSPGEPPARRSGHLRRSIATEPGERLTYRIGTNVFYGRLLEQGYQGNFTIAARPWLRRAFMECQPQIQSIMNAPIL